MPVNYVVVIPAFNEENYIEKTLLSLAGQHLQPLECMVVDDNSSDKTFEIAHSFSESHDFIHVIKNDNAQSFHAPGGKVIRAFNRGVKALAKIDQAEVVVKLDADLTLPPDYFSSIMNEFRQDDQTGIAGGVCYILKGGRWVPENVSDDTHVRGPIKSYRISCLEMIGGIPEHVGWDTLDEFRAKMEGWKIVVRPDLKVLHHRPTGQKNLGNVYFKTGTLFFRMRYGFFLSIISIAKLALTRKPYILSGVIAFTGYIWALLSGTNRVVSKEEGRFIRQERRQMISEKFRRR